VRDVLVVAASFAAAHSVTLLATAYGLTPGALWFPASVDTAIALSIVYLAAENIAGPNVHRRRVAAAVFGLVYGFAFALALTPSLQFSGSHPIASMLSFNVGVEAALLLVLVPAVAILALLFRLALPERISIILLSALVIHTAWHWLTTRGALLAQYQFTMPDMTPAFFVDVVRWLMVLVTAAGLTWLVGLLRAGDHSRSRTDSPSRTGA
jgi:HupE / UreJ protein